MARGLRLVKWGHELETEVLRAIGVAGFVLYMCSYGLVQLRRLDGNGRNYALMNMAAASCVLLSMLAEFNLSSALIQVSWIVISGVGLARHIFLRSRWQSPAESRLSG